MTTTSSKSTQKQVPPTKLPSVWRLLEETIFFIVHQKKIFISLGIIYAIISYVVVGGVSQVNLVDFKQSSQAIGQAGQIMVLLGATLSGELSRTSTELQQFLGGIISLIFWLALVWAARMLLAGKKIKVRDALYNSSAPIVPTIMLLCLIALQLLPAAIGLYIFSIAQLEHWVQSGLEVLLFGTVALGLCLVSIYWLSSSLLALVVVALPQTYPGRALSAAKQLVKGQRWRTILYILALLATILLVWIFILVPIIILDSSLGWNWLPLIPLTIQLLNAFSLVFASVYFYKMYRNLL